MKLVEMDERGEDAGHKGRKCIHVTYHIERLIISSTRSTSDVKHAGEVGASFVLSHLFC